MSFANLFPLAERMAARRAAALVFGVSAMKHAIAEDREEDDSAKCCENVEGTAGFGAVLLSLLRALDSPGQSSFFRGARKGNWRFFGFSVLYLYLYDDTTRNLGIHILFNLYEGSEIRRHDRGYSTLR